MWMKHHKEKMMSKMTKPEAINLSTILYMGAAIMSVLVSFFLQLTGKKEKSLWIGQWPATLLSLGLYDRMYKTMKLFKRMG